MKVYYSKGWAITFIIAGSILIALNYILFSLTGKVEIYRSVPGLMVIGVGILYLFRPYFELKDKELVTYSLLGFVAWRYKVKDVSDFIFEGNKLFRLKNGKMKRIRVSGFVCNKQHWNKFKALVERNIPGGELHD